MSLIDRFLGRKSQPAYERGMAAFNAGRLPEALEAFREVLGDGSNTSDPLVSLSCFYASEASHELGLQRLLAGDVKTAAGFFDEALQWNDHFPELQFHQALVCLWQDQRAAARPLLESVLTQNPDHFEARVLLAEVAFQEGAQAEGTQHLHAAQERGLQRPLDEALTQFLNSSAHPAVAAVLQRYARDPHRHSVQG